VVLRKLDPSDGISVGAAAYFDPTCTTAGTCTPGTISDTSLTATSQATATCLSAIAGTTRLYAPAVATSAAPCFSTAPATMIIELFGAQVHLQDAQVGATYSGTPATSLTNGLLMGFLTKAEADSKMATIELNSGKLSTFLPGGGSDCPGYSDMDMDGADRGWWMYFNFTATEATWGGP